MLINAKSLTGFTLNCLDGKIGKVKKFLFYDKLWTICYLVADIGNWITDRQILISSHALGAVMREKQRIDINLTKQQIEDSLSPGCEAFKTTTHNLEAQGLLLRNTHDVRGHHIQAADGKIGHVEDVIIDAEKWEIGHFVIDTRNWQPGKKVLIPAQWVERISSRKKKVFVNLSRESIKLSREYTAESLQTRDYEAGLHLHYNRVKLGQAR